MLIGRAFPRQRGLVSSVRACEPPPHNPPQDTFAHVTALSLLPIFAAATPTPSPMNLGAALDTDGPQLAGLKVTRVAAAEQRPGRGWAEEVPSVVAAREHSCAARWQSLSASAGKYKTLPHRAPGMLPRPQ